MILPHRHLAQRDSALRQSMVAVPKGTPRLSGLVLARRARGVLLVVALFVPVYDESVAVLCAVEDQRTWRSSATRR